MPYTPNVETVTEPLDGEKASTAAAEFRALKVYIRDRLLVKTAGGNVGIGGAADDAYRLTIIGTDADYPGINASNTGVILRALALSTGAVVGTYSNSALSFITNSIAAGGFAANGDFTVLRGDSTRDGFTVLPQLAGTGIITAARDPAFATYVPWVLDASRYDFRVGGSAVFKIDTGGQLRVGRAGALAGTQTFYPPDAASHFHIQNPGADYLEISQGVSPGVSPVLRLYNSGTANVYGNLTVGGTCLGLNNNASLSFKDTGGTYRRGMLLSGGDTFYVGDVDTALAGGSVLVVSGAATDFYVGGNLQAKITNSGFFPSSDNTKDLGSGALRWNQVYAAEFVGSLTGNASTATNATNATTAAAAPWSGITGKPTTRAGYGITDVPLVDGTGASGTWGINISGNAATATSATTAGSASSASSAPWSGITGKPTTVAGLSLSDLAAGTYTPTVTNVTNSGTPSADVCKYSRVGNIVTVSGRISVTPAGAGSTSWRMSLPVASTFTGNADAMGTLVSNNASTMDGSGYVAAFLGSGANTIQMDMNCLSASLTLVSFTVQYEVK